MALTSPGLTLAIDALFGNIKPQLDLIRRLGATDFAAENPGVDIKPGTTMKMPLSTVSEALAECRKMKCDAFIEANKAKIADVAACREAYMANPEAAEKLVAACKAPEAKTQTVLAAAKKTPEVKKDGESMATCREQMAALPANERAAFYKEHKADIDAGK